ncbi:MAG: hypothetical protein ABSA33_01930 [Candidatus Micrarchaeaceae archaeon]|jgi:hypothetical protein
MSISNQQDKKQEQSAATKDTVAFNPKTHVLSGAEKLVLLRNASNRESVSLLRDPDLLRMLRRGIEQLVYG